METYQKARFHVKRAAAEMEKPTPALLFYCSIFSALKTRAFQRPETPESQRTARKGTGSAATPQTGAGRPSAPAA